MKRLVSLFTIAIICFSCTSEKKEDDTTLLVKPVQKVNLNLGNGYAINQFSGDSILPIINSAGDQIETGINQTFQAKKWESENPPNTTVFSLDLPSKIGFKNNFKPNKMGDVTQWISNDSLQQKKVSANNAHVIITPQGDTIPTGRPVVLTPIITTAIHPEPVRAGNLNKKENTFHNLSYFDIEGGLNSPTLCAGIQDSRGDYWFATFDHGIIRYNGVSFINYTVNEGLSSNSTRSIIEDKEGNIWIGTQGNGLCMFNGDTFFNYSNENGFNSKVVFSLTKDIEGNIWAGTRLGGAAKFDGTYFTYFTKNEGLASNNIRSILQTKDGDYWFGNDLQGLSRYDGNTFWNYTPMNKAGSWRVNSIIEDKDETIWLGTSAGLTRLIREEKRVGLINYTGKGRVINKRITSVMQDNEGKIWITTWRHGILMYDPLFPENGFLNITANEGLTTDHIWFMLQGKNGDYWIGTELGGLNKLIFPSFNSYTEKSGLKGINYWDVMSTKNGDLWFSNEGNGLNQISARGKNKEINNFPYSKDFPSDLIMSMTEDLDGNIWLATWGYGLYHYSISDDQKAPIIQQFTEDDGLTMNNLFSLHLARNGDLWVGSPRNGLTRVSPNESGYDFYQYTDENGLGANKNRGIAEDSEGNIWVSSYNAGVTCFTLKENNEYSAITYSEKEGLSSNTIPTLFCDSKDNIWMGTESNGLIRYDGEVFQYYQQEQGLSDPRISSIVEDSTGNLWVGTAAGLNLIQPLTDGDYTITAYKDKDGLNGQDFFYNSSTIDNNNQFWAGTAKGLLHLDLNTFELKKTKPEVSLTGLAINATYYDYKNWNDTNNLFTFSGVDKWTNYPQNLELNYTANELSFYFNATNGGPKHKLKYQFKLEGNDSKWSSLTSENKVDYRGLVPGKYTFHVKAIGESSIWSDPFSYSFYIHPPWWKTNWAYFVYGLIILTFIYFINRIRLKRRLRIQEAQQERQLSKLKSIFFTNISHEFRTPLTLIKGVTDQLLPKVKGTEMEKEVLILERNSHHLLTTVNQLLELSKLDARKKTIALEPVNLVAFIEQYHLAYAGLLKSKELSLTFESTNPSIVIETDKTALGQIIQNLIGNAVKFTSEGGIKISIYVDKNQNARVQIADSGIGISPTHLPHIFDRFYQANDLSSKRYEGTGIGLALSKELVGLLNGDIQVTSRLNQGSTFYLSFPNATIVNKTVVEDSNIVIVMDKQLTTLPDNEQANEAQPTLLIVEDNADLRYFISSLLKDSYQIITADNGKIGLEMAIEYVPDFIISDWMMPIMDGPSMIQKIKINPITCHIPIMLLTAKTDQQSKLSGYRYGAEAYLTKPFESEELILRIQMLIESRNLIRYLHKQKFANPVAKEIVPKPVTVDDLFIEKTLEVIAAKIDDPDLNGEWLANQHNLSRSQFGRKLKAITNKNITEFIRSTRLEIAKQMLLKGHLSISEIAYKVGFSNPSYFTRVFTKEIGVTPSNYKK